MLVILIFLDVFRILWSFDVCRNLCKAKRNVGIKNALSGIMPNYIKILKTNSVERLGNNMILHI